MNEDTHPARFFIVRRKFIVDTESRILRNNSIAATLHDVPRGRLKIISQPKVNVNAPALLL